jgi:hypothetical protein
MPDAVTTHPPAEPATVDEPGGQRSGRKPSARKVTKRPAPKASKRGAGDSSPVHVKVGGGHTIAVPKGLAAVMTPKDEKRLVAIFKRVLRRQKKRAGKKRAAKKR